MHINTEKLTLAPGATVDLETGTVLTAKSGAQVQVADGAEVEILGTLKAGVATALVIPTYANSQALPTPEAAIYGAIGYLVDPGTLSICTATGWKVMALSDHTHA
jgi:hypothetical protein